MKDLCIATIIVDMAGVNSFVLCRKFHFALEEMDPILTDLGIEHQIPRYPCVSFRDWLTGSVSPLCTVWAVPTGSGTDDGTIDAADCLGRNEGVVGELSVQRFTAEKHTWWCVWQIAQELLDEHV